MHSRGNAITQSTGWFVFNDAFNTIQVISCKVRVSFNFSIELGLKVGLHIIQDCIVYRVIKILQ